MTRVVIDCNVVLQVFKRSVALLIDFIFSDFISSCLRIASLSLMYSSRTRVCGSVFFCRASAWLIVWFIVVHIGSPTVESLCDGIFFQETAALLTLVQISLKSARMTSYVSSFVATMV